MITNSLRQQFDIFLGSCYVHFPCCNDTIEKWDVIFFFFPILPSFWIIRMDVPLAVAMETETFQQRKFESLHPTQCQVYWSDARRDAAVLDWKDRKDGGEKKKLKKTYVYK